MGSTPTASYSFLESGLTEARPGNYVFFDLTQVALGSAGMLDCALTVLATVVSTPSAHRLVLDAGSKTLSSDDARGPGARSGFGAVCASYAKASSLINSNPPGRYRNPPIAIYDNVTLPPEVKRLTATGPFIGEWQIYIVEEVAGEPV